MELAGELRDLAAAAGCAGFGVTNAAAFPSVAADLSEQRSSGRSGKLGFTFKNPEVATDVKRSFSWATRIVVISWPYMPGAGNPGRARSGTGRVARFATHNHYAGLHAALDRIVAALHVAGWRAEAIFDDDRLVDRAVAVRAGVGWWGKSTMVLDPRHGPWLLLGSVITDAPLPVDKPMVRSCGTCDVCIPACPTGAIVAPGKLDATRCLAYVTQMGGAIPPELRVPLGDRVYGCDDCLEVCPPGRKQVEEASLRGGRVELLELLAAADASLLSEYDHFYIPHRNPRYLRRNALVALGNSVVATPPSQVEPIVAVLAGYLGDPDEMYRVHAAWALGRIATAAAVACLQHRLARERVPAVIAEIEAALREAGAADRGRDPSTLHRNGPAAKT